MEPKIGTQQYYFPEIRKLLESMDWEPDPEEIVWHYTGGPSLINIIESGTIYSTQVSCLNDATEIRYAAVKLHDALTATLSGIDPSTPEAGFLKKYIDVLKDSDEIPNNLGLPYFVSCFSTLKDDLSQWRSYAGGENGYAIGVKVKDLFGVPNSIVVRVNYESETHAKLAADIAEATVRLYKEGAESGIENWDDTFMTAWDSALTQLAPIVKDPGFAVEKEIRIVHQLQQAELYELRVIQKKNMMSRHFPIRFPSLGPLRYPRIPLQHVMVGPGRHKQISRISVDTLLRTHGYPAGCTVLSTRPYQET